MYAEILRLVETFTKHLIGLGIPTKRVRNLYKGTTYLEAYSQHTDLRVESEPHLAIGGHWEAIGRLQFEFLMSKGLSPHHKMLDIGCGTLRGGRHFIKYLNTGKYSGIDISSKAIMYANQLVQQEELFEKCPRLLVSENRDLKFREFSGETFDYILAQSVFTHLRPEHIKECFANIGHIMHESSAFYFTYRKGVAYRQLGLKDFCYSFSFFESLAEQHGFQLYDRSNEYNHPRGQRMIELLKNR
ncbi:methyltransferase [candidate division KSB3 bacterium]|uniref:Methyltransferase n=1 Tax=candidate division KSB3 bacterium TaxID=2044937 RepID=A0A9D5K0H2_9BACT|nr:methyltransferase [candidate division KSB3 bacterium]MBD3327131.1 methyltransferase [candidate division KSB3 bacterium]